MEGPGNVPNEFFGALQSGHGLPAPWPSKTPSGRKIGRTKPHVQQWRAVFCRSAAIFGFARVHCAGRMPAPPRKTRAGLAIGVGTHGADGPGRWPIARDSQKLIQGATPTLCKGKKGGVEPCIHVRFPRRLTKMATDASRCPSVDFKS